MSLQSRIKNVILALLALVVEKSLCFWLLKQLQRNFCSFFSVVAVGRDNIKNNITAGTLNTSNNFSGGGTGTEERNSTYGLVLMLHDVLT